MENIKFEEAMDKLELEVKRLESGNMSLDEALVSFENAVKLVKVCNEKLDAAESRVRILMENSDGTVTDRAFDSDNEA